MPKAEDKAEAEAAPAEPYPREAWYAACASLRLGDQPAAARVLDQDIVLFRGADGAPRALKDRCLHRGAQLSLGQVVEGALACRYHGWRYGGDGRCVHIPSLVSGAEAPGGLAIDAFPCAEADGYVWVWMGAGPATAAPAIEDFGAFDWLQGAMDLKCSALAVIENNLDWCHPVFAHPHTHGMFFMNQARGFQDTVVEVRLHEKGIVVFAPPTAAAEDLMPAQTWVSLAYTLPDRVVVGFGAGAERKLIVMHMVPTGPATCRFEWLFSTEPVQPGADPKVTRTDEVQAIFEQDRVVLESAQLAVDREGHAFERSVEADAPTLLARRVWALACAGRWEQDRSRLPQRRLVNLRS
jgi:phenylpropionate dioxygenase-like ring-hydroxylating dioxygenase large terminal subunit